MRTLIISDLHLGNRAGRDVLRRPAPRQCLIDAVREIDRLVILGDVAELANRHPERSLAVAEPVLRAVGAGLGREHEVILVPGNHDRSLIRGWARAQGPQLGLDAAVPLDATPSLARVARWCAPARVRVHYPGVWLTEGVYATHGHYLDRHLIPHAPIGLPRRGRSEHDPGRASPWDYEQRRIRARQQLQSGGRKPSPGLRLANRLVSPALPRLLMRAGLSSLTATAVDAQMRHAALPAMQTVVARLQVEAETVIFGHVHRLGPLTTDDPGDWQRENGPRLLNTGSWLYERLLIDRAQTPHPYWPGGAVELDGDRPPRAVGLLDDLSHAELWTPK